MWEVGKRSIGKRKGLRIIINALKKKEHLSKRKLLQEGKWNGK